MYLADIMNGSFDIGFKIYKPLNNLKSVNVTYSSETIYGCNMQMEKYL